jgi:hypothetical protein
VLGTVVARITPLASSAGSMRLASQPSGGAMAMLINDPSHAGPGRRTARHSRAVCNGNAITKVTIARITSPDTISAAGRMALGHAMPIVSTARSAMRNQRW